MWKKGCFERYASMKAFKNNLRKALGVDETTRGQELLDIIRKSEDNTKEQENEKAKKERCSVQYSL